MYPGAYINYLVHFHGDRDYFECHEVLEEYWKQEKRGERKIHWVGLIQIAVALYHQRRGNFSGAKRMLQNAITILEQERVAILSLGLDYEDLLSLLHKRLFEIKQKVNYTSINLPITDEHLIETCVSSCNKLDLEWGSVSPLNNEELIHKHKIRDRSEVIAEREKQQQLKRRKK